jgi:hypothetical protein
MRWQQGRDTIDGMIARGELQRVPASREHADLLLTQAHQHLGSAHAIATSDAAGAYKREPPPKSGGRFKLPTFW